jgi:hypothetical protein
MSNLKHVGRQVNNKRKVVVAYRVVPGEPESCIVVPTESLMAEEHDALMKLVESDAGQSANELADAMARTRLPDGRIMLAAFHTTGRFSKMPTKAIEMTPNRNTVVNLAELNEAIAQQKGVAVEDLAVKPTTPTQTNQAETTTPIVEEAVVEPLQAAADGVLSDEDLAAQYRSQADAMFKEAKRLREQAEELAPTKKKTATKKTEESV